MGHYRSEMVSDEEHQAEADHAKLLRDATAKRIRGAIEMEGVEFVLADILADPLMARIRYRRLP